MALQIHVQRRTTAVEQNCDTTSMDSFLLQLEPILIALHEYFLGTGREESTNALLGYTPTK